jgi:hypothetical protein
MFGVAFVEAEQAGTIIAVLWGIVIVGGLGGLALQSSDSEGGGATFGRLLMSAAMFALLPAITLSCTAALS